MWLSQSALKPLPIFARVSPSVINEVEDYLDSLEEEETERNLDAALERLETTQPAIANILEQELVEPIEELPLAVGFSVAVVLWLCFEKSPNLKLRELPTEDVDCARQLLQTELQLRAQRLQQTLSAAPAKQRLSAPPPSKEPLDITGLVNEGICSSTATNTSDASTGHTVNNDQADDDDDNEDPQLSLSGEPTRILFHHQPAIAEVIAHHMNHGRQNCENEQQIEGFERVEEILVLLVLALSDAVIAPSTSKKEWLS